MKISIIIPTHNRSDLLKNVIDSVFLIQEEADFEFVVVDNNSTDGTKQLIEKYSDRVKYVFEKCTSFTKARSAGADNASGDILLYLDDDVVVNPGSLRNIDRIFSEYPECGVIAGKILPKYLDTPPSWTLDCQNSFNGWSLFYHNPDTFNGKNVKQVNWAAGPMMAIRRTAYEQVGGFPPDTIGVETNKGDKTFNKLYIGPGDYGLCFKVIEKGWKVLYNDNISIYHLIPSVRFTVKFWRSRMIGEGYHEAITQREFFKLDSETSKKKLKKNQKLFYENSIALMNKINNQDLPNNGVSPEELWMFYYKAYLDMDAILSKYSYLSSYLWEIGIKGVDDSNFDSVMSYLPEDFKQLVDNEYVYNNVPIDSVYTYNKVMKDFGHQSIFLTQKFKIKHKIMRLFKK